MYKKSLTYSTIKRKKKEWLILCKNQPKTQKRVVDFSQKPTTHHPILFRHSAPTLSGEVSFSNKVLAALPAMSNEELSPLSASI